jgi:hypothetical protein
MKVVLSTAIVAAILAVALECPAASAEPSGQEGSKSALKGEIEQIGIYQPTNTMGCIMMTPPGPLLSTNVVAEAKQEVAVGFLFTFSGLGSISNTTVKFTMLQPETKGLIGTSMALQMPVENGKLSRWAGMRIRDPAIYDPNPLPLGDYTIVVEVMGQSLRKTFTFK